MQDAERETLEKRLLALEQAIAGVSGLPKWMRLSENDIPFCQECDDLDIWCRQTTCPRARLCGDGKVRFRKVADEIDNRSILARLEKLEADKK